MDAKYITNFAILNTVLRLKVVNETIAEDVKQRILDWLQDPRNTIHDEYVLRQGAAIERHMISRGYDLEDFFKDWHFPEQEMEVEEA